MKKVWLLALLVLGSSAVYAGSFVFKEVPAMTGLEFEDYTCAIYDEADRYIALYGRTGDNRLFFEHSMLTRTFETDAVAKFQQWHGSSEIATLETSDWQMEIPDYQTQRVVAAKGFLTYRNGRFSIYTRIPVRVECN